MPREGVSSEQHDLTEDASSGQKNLARTSIRSLKFRAEYMGSGHSLPREAEDNEPEIDHKNPGKGPLIPRMPRRSRWLKERTLESMIFPQNIKKMPESSFGTVMFGKGGRSHTRPTEVCVTKTHVYLNGQGQLFDSIPLEEISAVTVEEVEGAQWAKIATYPEGGCSGRWYCIRDELESPTEMADTLRSAAEDRFNNINSKWRQLRLRIRDKYTSQPVQLFITAIICISFIMVCIEAQEQPVPGSQLGNSIALLDLIFTIVFTADLLLNFYVHFFVKFATDPWNLLDSAIVLLSVISVINYWTAKLDALRFFGNARAFRIFRLAGKFTQLRRIIDAIGMSIVPMASGFLIALIFGSTFTVLGTAFFKSTDPENFGTFSRTFWTLWLAVAFGIWENGLNFLDEEKEINFGVVIYMLFFVVAMLWISLQVVLAILLENFVSAQKIEEDRSATAELKAAKLERESTGGLDVLLDAMMSEYDTTDEMMKGITKVFIFLDSYEEGLRYEDFHVGLKKLNTKTDIQFSSFDWRILTRDVTLLDSEERMSLPNFHRMMTKQLQFYVQWHVAKVQSMNPDAVESKWTLSALRMLFLDRAKKEKGVMGGAGEPTSLAFAEKSLPDSDALRQQDYSAQSPTSQDGFSSTLPLDPPERSFTLAPTHPSMLHQKGGHLEEEGACGEIMRKFRGLDARIVGLTSDTAETKHEVGVMRGEMNEMRGEMEDMRSDMHGIRGDIRNLMAFLKSQHEKPLTPQGGASAWVAEMSQQPTQSLRNPMQELGGATATLFQNSGSQLPFKPYKPPSRDPSPRPTRPALPLWNGPSADAPPSSNSLPRASKRQVPGFPNEAKTKTPRSARLDMGRRVGSNLDMAPPTPKRPSLDPAVKNAAKNCTNVTHDVSIPPGLNIESPRPWRIPGLSAPPRPLSELDTSPKGKSSGATQTYDRIERMNL